MLNYDSYIYEELDWRNRYPVRVKGRSLWKAFSAQMPPVELDIVDRPGQIDFPPFPDFEEFGRLKQRPRALVVPRVFVSYKSDNRDLALRIAYLVNKEGFNYWMDVFDPNLVNITNSHSISDKQKTLLIASIIEMGLLNSTHMMACMTDKTKSSNWVPYEFGRVKDRSVLADQASSWRHPNVVQLPEYMYLCPIHDTEKRLVNWLGSERTKWEKKNNMILTKPATKWVGPIPKALP